MENITLDNFRKWLNSLPPETAFDFGNPVHCAAARFYAHCTGNALAAVYTPLVGRGCVHAWTKTHNNTYFDDDDDWFAVYSRWEYANRVKTVASALKFTNSDQV